MSDNALQLSDADIARVASGGETSQWILHHAEAVVVRVTAEARHSKAEADALLQDLEMRFITMTEDTAALAAERDHFRDDASQQSMSICGDEA